MPTYVEAAGWSRGYAGDPPTDRRCCSLHSSSECTRGTNILQSGGVDSCGVHSPWGYSGMRG